MTDTQALWPQMIRALAEIDDALGLPQDGCNSTERTLAAIRDLKWRDAAAHARIASLSATLRDYGTTIEQLRDVIAELRGGEK